MMMMMIIFMLIMVMMMIMTIIMVLMTIVITTRTLGVPAISLVALGVGPIQNISFLNYFLQYVLPKGWDGWVGAFLTVKSTC